MRVALCIEYDGGAFHGWQTQPDGRTVQDALEKALTEIAGQPISVSCAGRTDTGVHATAQVAHFDCPAERPLSAWVRGANTLLPDSVAVRWAHPVPDDFHARFSARGRRYRYVLVNR
ncbi:MAG TPA: tRNA pseudouridine synthase A, partial [Azospira sp.]|nr:tRNA pseudouridine synthase A [Azospira sp.]